jgi:AcrR family transcriptional regulator
MAKKAPRRTAERILETTLSLFNRFGELNVTTTLIASQMGISPGNLYYHFPTKEELINVLYEHFETRFEDLLNSPTPSNLEEAKTIFFALVKQIWDYRFLFRDLSHFLSKNRHLELEFPKLIRRQSDFFNQCLQNLHEQGCLKLQSEQACQIAKVMSQLLTHWISEEYVHSPRQALEPEQAEPSQARVIALLFEQVAPFQA